MEQRRGLRKIDNLDAEFTADDVLYSGIVLNLSENGLYMVTATKYDVKNIEKSTPIKMQCKLPSGECLNLDCEVKWFQTKPSPFGVTCSMGMEIKNPPDEYREFVKSLQ